MKGSQTARIQADEQIKREEVQSKQADATALLTIAIAAFFCGCKSSADYQVVKAFSNEKDFNMSFFLKTHWSDRKIRHHSLNRGVLLKSKAAFLLPTCTT